MSELSPAAQAVLENSLAQTDLDLGYANMIAAAAIRTAVEHTQKRKVSKTFGVVMAQSAQYCLSSELLNIAVELENYRV